MFTMVNPIDCRGHSSKVNVTIGIIDKCEMRGYATLCFVIFHFVLIQYYFGTALFIGRDGSVHIQDRRLINVGFLFHVLTTLLFYTLKNAHNNI